MWIFLWVVLSIFVMGVFFWSMFILQQQKRAWFAFAKKSGLKYEAGAYTDPPVISGIVKGYKVTFFTDSLRTQDVRGRRFVTTIEVEMGDGMPTVAALATQDFADFLSPLRLPLSWQPPGEDWQKNYIIKTRSTDRLVRYLTKARLKVLSDLYFTYRNTRSFTRSGPYGTDRKACIRRRRRAFAYAGGTSADFRGMEGTTGCAISPAFRPDACAAHAAGRNRTAATDPAAIDAGHNGDSRGR